jgi:hypothetical protein
MSSKWSILFRISSQNYTCIPHVSHAFYVCRPSQPPDFITLIVLNEKYKLWSSSLCNFLQPLVTSSLPQHPVLTLSPCSYLNMRDQASHPYNMKNYSPVDFNLQVFRWQTGRPKILNWMVASITWIYSALNLFLNAIFIIWCLSKIFSPLKIKIKYFWRCGKRDEK